MEGICDIWEAVTLGVCNSKQDGATALTNNANYVNLHCFDCILGAFLVLFLGVANTDLPVVAPERLLMKPTGKCPVKEQAWVQPSLAIGFIVQS